MFYITISNGLLEEKHYEKMGAAVWQFMWCIDKVTRIDEDGTGWVLGGKPIQLKDIPVGSRNTNSRNLQKLEEEGYLKLIHTPYGISIRVLKTKKRFTKKDTRLPNNGEPKRFTKSGEPNIRHNSLDNTIDNTDTATVIEKKEYGEFKNVKLDQFEMDKLNTRIGEKNVLILIEELATYKESTGTKYRSDYATLLNWARRKYQENQRSQTKSKERRIV